MISVGADVVSHLIFRPYCPNCRGKERECLTVKISDISQRHTEQLSLFSFMTLNKQSSIHES